MGSGSLWDLIVGTGLDGVDQVGELDGVLDKKYRNIVANDIWACMLVFCACVRVYVYGWVGFLIPH